MGVDTNICMDWCELGDKCEELSTSRQTWDFESFILAAVEIINAIEHQIEKLRANYCTEESKEDKKEYVRMLEQTEQWIEWATDKIQTIKLEKRRQNNHPDGNVCSGTPSGELPSAIS
ncbi:hypothetical protein F5Y12DRAFT_717360 [Xylaria sp. FL1777]|nr:hypothetical protein F5Y12DRAFT_717360 [Xylaria sp. FL1777]